MKPQNLLKPNIEEVLQEAVYRELFTSNLYKHLSNQMQYIGYSGAASFFASESSDELEHYNKHKEFLNNRGSFAAIPELPPFDYVVKTLGEALQIAYDVESGLNDLYEQWTLLASKNDMTTFQYLLQFLEIQQKSVGKYSDLLSRLSLVEDDKAGILLIDKEMGE